jgi:hypothetical protein
MPPRTIEQSGSLVVEGSAGDVFELFSPLGEKAWVPGWDPELLYPPGAAWERGQVFRTREEHGEAVWVVTSLDRSRLEVEYHRVEAGRWVARVLVSCSPRGTARTDVTVSYLFVGLSPSGDEEIGRMSAAEYEAKLRRWRDWIADHLGAGSGGGSTAP